jgi:hypothetical protein
MAGEHEWAMRLPVLKALIKPPPTNVRSDRLNKDVDEYNEPE